MKHIRLWIVVVAAVVIPASATATMVTITSVRDNTLYEDGEFSNGSGPGMFAGRVGGRNGGLIRRALVAFDVAGNVPAGATITSASLTLTVTKTPFPITTFTSTLHRCSADWGESTSNAGLDADGAGDIAAVGDATWMNAFSPGTPWASAGGDFSPTVSASLGVTNLGPYTWGSTPEMVADVQAWLDTPASNFGWLLKGDESTLMTPKRYATREHADISSRPKLTIEYDDMTPTLSTTWGAIKNLYRP